VFRYIQEKLHTKGSTERLVQDFHQNEVLLGKGGSSHIILPGHRISPVHAKFSWDGTSLVVTDLGSLAGVRINNRRVSSATVRDGDTILLGDMLIRVAILGDTVELTGRLDDVTPVPAGDDTAHQLRQLQIESYLPAMRYLLVGAAVITFVVAGLYPFVMRDFVPFNSGPISNSHGLIAKDCQKCHREPFVPVQDTECLSCHAMTEHSRNFSAFTTKHPDLSLRCGQCHMEHNGTHGLVLNDAQFCTNCHASMTTHLPDASVLNVASLRDHPQFHVSMTNERGEAKRVSLDDAVHARDQSHIKLNHSVHLQKGLRGKDGPVTLNCNSCHQLADNFRSLKPISFDSHCSECHALTFDERIPNVQVPHGDSEAVYPALFTEYAKLLSLGGVGAQKKSVANGEFGRMFPSSKPQESAPPATSGSVGEIAREAERQLFTRTGCFLCHSYVEKDALEKTETNSYYQVKKPRIPDTWLPKSRFSHGAHESFTCESCHEKARNSSETSDILLPKVALCQECHAQGATPGHVDSGCAACHSYHDAIGFPDEKKQTIADYLHALTR
jgi:hypothetical protein